MKPSEALKKAYELIKEHKCEKKYAIDKYGNSVDASSSNAVAWCAVGALFKTFGIDPNSRELDNSVNYLEDASVQIFNFTVTSVNDYQPKQDIFRVYELAIENAEAAGN